MVSQASAYDFAAVIDAFFDQKKLSGPHASLITSTVRSRALELLAHPDVRYMPVFKVLDLLATVVNIATAIADAPQLRPAEVQSLLRESLSNDTALIRHFLLDAALERARYEPLMLHDMNLNAEGLREQMLERRWAAMRATHQEWAKLPEEWLEILDQAVERALEAEEFREFRQGPLLQLFAEMLSLARGLHQQGATPDQLALALDETGVLWRRYALKSQRFREPAPAPLDLSQLTPHGHRLH